MTQTARPDSDVSDGNWTNQDENQTNLYASIDESSVSDSDYVQSQDDSAATDTMIVGLSDVDDPESAADHKVYFRAQGDPGGGFSVPPLIVALLEGSTQRATVTVTPANGSYGNHNFTLTTAEANSIGDYDNLRLKLVRNSSDGGFENVRVSQAYFECPDASASAVSNPAFLLFVD